MANNKEIVKIIFITHERVNSVVSYGFSAAPPPPQLAISNNASAILS